MKYGFGVDIGGTNIKIGFFDITGDLKKSWSIRTDVSDGGRNILPTIAEEVGQYLAGKGIGRADLAGIGLGVPGPVTGAGVVLKCVNLGWGVFNVEEALSKLTGLPVKAGNDANIAALGEMWRGAALGYENLVMVTLGTGVGGGVISRGRIVEGANGAGGEIGHITVNKAETIICACGRRGCLEQYASGAGIARIAAESLKAYSGVTALREYEAITAKEVFSCAESGDAFAMELVDEISAYLGGAMANIACVCDPEVFVLGGGVSHAGETLLDAVEKHYRQNAFHAAADSHIVLAALGGDAGMYGGMKLLLDSGVSS